LISLVSASDGTAAGFHLAASFQFPTGPTHAGPAANTLPAIRINKMITHNDLNFFIFSLLNPKLKNFFQSTDILMAYWVTYPISHTLSQSSLFSQKEV
jgi:hypothetical protein